MAPAPQSNKSSEVKPTTKDEAQKRAQYKCLKPSC